MIHSVRITGLSLALALVVAAILVYSRAPAVKPSSPGAPPGLELVRSQPGLFVPNLGQWRHDAKFVHHSGLMSVFLAERGWTMHVGECVDTDESMPSAARYGRVEMIFEGDTRTPHLVGEQKQPGHHNYFLGDDRSHWRTDVPLYGSVRYEGLYQGIDLRLRQSKGSPEYDLLLAPGADLSRVAVRVTGVERLAIGGDGSLVMVTELGPITQSAPRTWQTDAEGRRHAVACDFVLLDDDRFGFTAPSWAGDTPLTIDPGLIWSTLFGADTLAQAMDVDKNGIVTICGAALRPKAGYVPVTKGAYSSVAKGTYVAFVSRLDPSKSGGAQLLYSTYLGGGGFNSLDRARHLSVDSKGVITLAGDTKWSAFPTTTQAFDITQNGFEDMFVCRLDPSKSGAAQLIYSTFVGGAAADWPEDMFVDSAGRVTVAANTASKNLPTTSGAYDSGSNGFSDCYVFTLDATKKGASQLTYATYFRGNLGSRVHPRAVHVDRNGWITIAGAATATTKFPLTKNAFDTVYSPAAAFFNGEGFVSRLDPSRSGSAQLVYSTFLGGKGAEDISAMTVLGPIVTVTGWTTSSDFPTTKGAFETRPVAAGQNRGFVCKLLTTVPGKSALIYSTLFGGSGFDQPRAIVADLKGGVTVAGVTASSSGFPLTEGAFDTVYGGADDVFVTRFDTIAKGDAQLVRSTLLGGKLNEWLFGLHVDADDVVTVMGYTKSKEFPTTSGAFDSTVDGFVSAYITRLTDFVTDKGEIVMAKGGTQNFRLLAGRQHAGRTYWVVGSFTGTTPGVTVGTTLVPLNLDIYTDLTIANRNTAIFKNTFGVLDSNGRGSASFYVPVTLGLNSFTLHHAYVVFDKLGNVVKASMPRFVFMR